MSRWSNLRNEHGIMVMIAAACAIVLLLVILEVRSIPPIHRQQEEALLDHQLLSELDAIAAKLRAADSLRTVEETAQLINAELKITNEMKIHLAKARELASRFPELSPLLSHLEQALTERELRLKNPLEAQTESDSSALRNTQRSPGLLSTASLAASVETAKKELQEAIRQRLQDAGSDDIQRRQMMVLASVLVIGALLTGIALLHRAGRASATRTEEILTANATLAERVDTSDKSRNELQRFFNLALDMFCITSLDGTIKSANAAFETTLGYPPAELIGRPFLDFVHADDRGATIREMQRLAEGANVSSFHNRYVCKDGRVKWLSWRAVPQLDQGLVYAAARDITARLEAEAEIRELNASLERRSSELEAANKELEAFTYSVSHDLRAPLRHIDGFSRLLVEEHSAELSEAAREYISIVRDGCRQMGQLVDDLLNLARLGRKPISAEATGLNRIVESTVSELKTVNRDRNIEWSIGSLPFVECDPALVRHVFQNLLSNAVKYTRPREVAKIEVGSVSNESCPVIFVRDNGVGFSMKHADKLFGVFQRLHRQEDFEGTGVGLAIVQRIVQKHGGRIWAEAELNQGATFYFTLSGSKER